MNEELKNQFQAFLLKALEVAQKGINATEEALPELLRQIVAWQFWSNVATAIAMILLIVLILLLRLKFSKIFVEWSKEDEYFEVGFASVISWVVAAGLCFGVLCQFCKVSLVAIKAYCAPYLVVIDSLKGLLG